MALNCGKGWKSVAGSFSLVVLLAVAGCSSAQEATVLSNTGSDAPKSVNPIVESGIPLPDPNTPVTVVATEFETPTPSVASPENDAASSGYADVLGLPQPTLDHLLPAGLSQANPEDALGLIATPVNTLTPAFKDPLQEEPILALNRYTDHMLNMKAHWAVVGQRPGWVRVMVPVGRGALPSVNPRGVNHRTVWVPESSVTLSEAQYRIEVSVADRTLTVTGPDGETTFHVGVGIEGKTDTPKGLCAVAGGIVTQTGVPGLLTSCQSEKLLAFEGATDAATAIHVGTGFDPDTGDDVSNGCVRVPEETFMKYLRYIPAGTPVIIK